jgi:hypothetical protein
MTTVEPDDPGLKFENHISELQADQNYKILNMLNRLSRLDRRFRNFDVPVEKRALVKHFRNTIFSMYDSIDEGKDMLNNLIYINRKIVQLESEYMA